MNPSGETSLAALSGRHTHRIVEKDRRMGKVIVNELAHTLAQHNLVDEFWFWVNPHIWPTGPQLLRGVGPIRLELIAATPYRSGVVWLRYRPADL
ncbi:hypothetical protein [Nocardia wallacei]|uniref:hypothetical protein n=2 Tax=Nocardia wallacei TaxID=480035 RepID=UPI0024546E61|nr:hypothetical protein [Nocardia wallacei]